MLFTNRQRNDSSPQRSNESDFNFLDRSADEAVDQIRELLEGFIAHYPQDAVPELTRRIQGADGHQFSSATFELCLHEYFLRQGMKLTLHPELPNGSAKQPDFLVECPDGQRLYVEAKSPPQKSATERAADARKNVVLEALNNMRHPDFMLSINSKGSPKTPPSSKNLVGRVREWLDQLDPDDLMAPDRLMRVSPLRWEHEGWRLILLPLPIVKDRRGMGLPSLGIQASLRRRIDRSTPIREAVRAKSNYYGDLDLPLVVAVSFDSFRLQETDEVRALFGDVPEEQSSSGLITGSVPPRDGAWMGANGARGGRGSGAWIFSNLRPDTVARARDVLYLNPTANHPVPDSFLTMSHASVVEGSIQHTKGIGLAGAFNLPFGWPVSRASDVSG